MQYIQVALHSLPINLICCSDASVVFVVVSPFKTIIDNDAIFDMDSFEIAGNKFQYDVQYY